MLSFLPAPARGALAFALITINTLFWAVLLFPAAALKLIPVPAFRRMLSRVLIWISENWIACNNLSFALLNRVEWEFEGLSGLSREQWYLVISNHQSWADILVLQKMSNRRIPFLKFFLKQELIWVPVLGLAWWALDFPFMKRFSRAELEKNPSLRGKDLETTRRACARFKTTPVSVMNFVEGTRFTPAKRRDQGSPFRRLLKPKAAGTAFTLAALGKQMTKILDVTIIYPEGAVTLWQYMCGKARQIKVLVRALPITADIIGDYDNDEAFRARFQAWLNQIWQEKDELIAQSLARQSA